MAYRVSNGMIANKRELLEGDFFVWNLQLPRLN